MADIKANAGNGAATESAASASTAASARAASTAPPAGSARASLSSPERQAEFMQFISERLRRPRVTEQPAHPFRGVPDFWREYSLEREDRIEMFMSNWTALGGHAFRFQAMDEVKKFVQEFVQETGTASVLLQDQPALSELGLADALPDVKCLVWDAASDQLLVEAARADVGIAVVDHAAAYTGTVVALSSPEKGRSTSLLPKAFIAIVPADKIEANLGPILKGLDGHTLEDIPAGIHFITGPSRSSDIENDLTIGVHGPGIVYALVVG